MGNIDIVDIYKEFPVSDGVEVAVEQVDLTIEDGEFVSLVGPSGCGKTTTLRCVAGLETPTEGDIYINGERVTNKPPQRRDLSMVFQDIALYPHMTTRENIGYPLKLQGESEETIEEKIQEATETLQINELLDKRPGELSGGQAQRVSLARAIVRDPVGFLLDEPMSDLDAKLKMEMRKELGKIHKEFDATMLYVTHDQEEAMTLSDKLAVMNDGRLEQVASPEEVYQNPANIFVAQFIGSPSINLMDARLDSISGNEVSINLPSGETLSFRASKEKSVDLNSIPNEVTLGFRPKQARIRDTDEPGIPASVVINEPIGGEVIQYLDGPQGEVRAVVSSEEVLDEGKEVSIGVQNSGVYLFDESGERVVRGERKSRPIAIA